MSIFDIEFAAVTDIGKIREKNEDNVLISSELGLGVVADGMGGHSAGEIASSIAVSVLAESIRKINTAQDFVYKYNKSLTTIVIIQTATRNQEKTNASLCTKDITESYNNFAATNIIEILMNREKIYSAFPCPKL